MAVPAIEANGWLVLAPLPQFGRIIFDPYEGQL